MLQDYKPVFATIPKAHDDSRSGRQSASDQYKSYGQPSYDRPYEAPGISLLPGPRRDCKYLCRVVLCHVYVSKWVYRMHRHRTSNALRWQVSQKMKTSSKNILSCTCQIPQIVWEIVQSVGSATVITGSHKWHELVVCYNEKSTSSVVHATARLTTLRGQLTRGTIAVLQRSRLR